MKLISSGNLSNAKSAIKTNQDFFASTMMLSDGYLMAIADGVGGNFGGEIASRLAISELVKINEEYLTEPTNVLKRIKETFINSLNDQLTTAATTLTYCYLKKEKVYIGHVGDCRLYIKKKNKLEQITKDQTKLQALIDGNFYTKKELKQIKDSNMLMSYISKVGKMEVEEIIIPTSEIINDDGLLMLVLMSDGAHKFWHDRPRFSENTLGNPNRFVSSLQRRIEHKGPIDDYTICASLFDFN